MSMLPDLSFTSGEELIKEIFLLQKVRANLESLVVHNSNLQPCMDQLETDIKQLKGLLFFKYHQFKKVDLESIIVDMTELQTRMLKYLSLQKDFLSK